jgi:hypothetical protein
MPDDTIIRDADPFEGAEIISSYSRAQAIEDGQLVDVSEIAKEAGLRWPTVITAAVWAMIEDIPAGLRGSCQDVKGRLWDVLWMAKWAAHNAPDGTDLVPYELKLPTSGTRKVKVTLWLHCGPGDDPEPVLTIMTPEDY